MSAEKDRLQHTVDLMLPRGFGQELLDLVEGVVALPSALKWKSPGNSTIRAPGMCSAR